VPLTFELDDAGILNVTDLKYDHLGGSSNVEVTAREITNSTTQAFNITFYYSRWNYSFPPRTNFIEFIPSRPNVSNITPYGQRSNYPILNLTFLGYGGRAQNLSVYMNESFLTGLQSCVNTTMSNTSLKYNGIQLNNNTWVELIGFNDYLYNGGMWLFADYNCNYTTWKSWKPYFFIRSCCEDCVCSESLT
jgi:hypothetical protein